MELVILKRLAVVASWIVVHVGTSRVQENLNVEDVELVIKDFALVLLVGVELVAT